MKLKPSIAFEDMRGSAGGFTASKNYYRLYAKNRISPRNPQTKRQQQVRGDLTSNSRNWAALTDEQRSAWDEAAKDQKTKSVMGEKAKLTGFNYFVRISQNLAVLGLPYKENPPQVMPEFPIFENNMMLPDRGEGYFTGYEEQMEESPYLHMPMLPDGMVWILRLSPGFKNSRKSNPTAVRTYGKVQLTTTYDEESKNYRYVFQGNAESSSLIPSGLNDGKIQSELYILDTNTGITSLKQVSIGTYSQLQANWSNASIEMETVNDATVIAKPGSGSTNTPAVNTKADPAGGEAEEEFVKKTNQGRTVMKREPKK